MARSDIEFVLDCSVTMTWCFEDEASEYGDAIRRRLMERAAIVPAIWPFEVANVCLIGERKGRLDEPRTLRFFDLLNDLPIHVEEATNQVFGAVDRLARAYRLTSYDASYLELAIRKKVAFATLDSRLSAAALAAGVPLMHAD